MTRRSERHTQLPDGVRAIGWIAGPGCGAFLAVRFR